MNTKLGNISCLVLVTFLAVANRVEAQIFTNDLPLQADTTGSYPVDFEFRADGTLIAKGNLGTGSLLSTDQGAGTRMLWFADLAALRAGSIDSTANTYTPSGGSAVTFTGMEWDSENIGLGSVALGVDTVANQPYAVAMGYLNIASGTASVAMGYDNLALGNYSAAFGESNQATGLYSTAFGEGTVSSGNYSTTLGLDTSATALYATAFGHSSSAIGYYCTAFGYATVAAADGETVFGRSNLAPATTVHDYGEGGNSGQFNVYTTDPIFELGNGTSSTALSDALIVYRNGNMTAQGSIRCSPGGDISMGNFTSTTGTVPSSL
jgi:hypothetical protein